MESLESLVTSLEEGLRRSAQGGYERRAPAPAAVPYLTRARDGLRRVVAERPERADALSWLSLAHEALLEYEDAVECLDRVREIRGSLDREELRRLARLKEAARVWSEMPLTADELRRLGAFLTERVTGPAERSFRYTREWLEANGVADVDGILDRFREMGAQSDFQLLSNVVRG